MGFFDLRAGELDRSWTWKPMTSAVIGAVVLAACAQDFAAEEAPAPAAGTEACARTDLDSPPVPSRHTARWAFEPWISKDISDRSDTYVFVDGFRSRGIPVGAVVLDSPWETNYNTFVPNPTRYGDMRSLADDMHARGVRVVLWITQMVNERSYDFEPGGDRYDGASPNFDEGQRCGYFVAGGTTFGWWKGSGAAVDFFDANARAWWHRQQDPVLNAGIDGWKLDFGDSYVRTDPVQTAEGPKPHQEYSERYYADYLAYGRSVRGPDFVTMVRAWDASYDFPGRFFAKKEDAPVAWMGDNRRDWVGLEDALDEMFVSARAGYVVLGSDIGGYLDRDDMDLLGPEIPFDTLTFARWTAVGALSPFMQLHGRASITPWTVPDHVDETVALYKYWATLHHALVPFLYSLAEKAYATDGRSLVSPVGAPDAWRHDYRWVLGDAFLVAPLLDASGRRAVTLPDGARWYDWWSTATADGGTTVQADFASDRAKVPLWVREGAIVPVDVADDVLGLGDAQSAGARTVLVWPTSVPTSFEVLEVDGSRVTVGAAATAGGWEVHVSPSRVPVILRVRSESAPLSVAPSDARFTYDAVHRVAILRLEPSTNAVAVTAQLR